MSKLVYIDAPEALTRRQRTVFGVLTALMWAAYGYLWLPLLSLLLWGFGIELAYDAMVRDGGASALRTALVWYAIMLADVIVTVAIWSQVNKWRFTNRNRRTAHPKVSDAAMAAYFGVTTADLERLRDARRIELDVDMHGRPVLPPVVERRSRPRRATSA